MMLFKSKNTFKEELYEHIKLREGYKDVIYLDTLNKPTGGIGHLLNDEEKEKFPVGSKIDEALIKEWYEKDIQKALDACNEQCKKLGLFEKKFKIALTSVNFQLGTRWYKKFPTAWKCLCNKEYDNAIDELLYSNKEEKKYSKWYRQTPIRVKDFIDAINDIKGEHNG